MRVTDSTKHDKTLNRPYVIGVAGGSGSGKTYFSTALRRLIGDDQCSVILQDNFYFDQSEQFDFDGGSVNFDHPSSIDFKLLAECLVSLKTGVSTQIPIYDFITHTRSSSHTVVEPRPVIIVDGILILHDERVRHQLHYSVFFDTPEELRYARRLHRDVNERGRTQDGVRAQFQKQVKPMHDLFVEPSKLFADVVMTESDSFDAFLQGFSHQLKSIL